ncbi:MAG: PIG-L family deacetylase [Flavobacteriales bacterium]
MLRKNFALFLVLLFTSPLFAQNSAEILLNLKKLQTTGSVLYIAAHPDDENTRLLAYLANERKLRTGYLSLTRGDGGQNLIGTEQGEPLGLIRTNELMAARGIDKAEQFFSRAYDFGYSKNPEETFGFWNRDSILADMVWVIRTFKPDVIICRFPTTGEGGHGHHTASAILAEDAFEAAADPKRFSHQLQYTQVWQAKRLLWNTFNFGGNNTTSEDQLKVDVGNYNVLMGRSYGEIASESRSMHKSQGFGSARQRGFNLEYFKHMKGDVATTDIMDGVDVNWTRIAMSQGIQAELNECVFNYRADAPEKTVAMLVSIYKKIEALKEDGASISYWKKIKLEETKQLILASSGFYGEAVSNDHSVVPGEQFQITTNYIFRNNVNASLKSIVYENGDSTVNAKLEINKLYSPKHLFKLSTNAAFSNPYWLNEKHSLGEFEISPWTTIGKPLNDAACAVILKAEIEGLPLQVKLPIQYKFTDPVKGEIFRPLEVLPPVTFTQKQKALVFNERKERVVEVIVHSNQTNAKGQIVINAGADWKVECDNCAFDLSAKNTEQVIRMRITPSAKALTGELQIAAKINGKEYNQSMQRIDYDHIPNQFILSPAKFQLVFSDIKMIRKNIGYIDGAGDGVAASLEQIGCSVTMLSDEEILTGDLSKYEAIITGVRAYNTNDRMIVYYDRLMEYVKNGGNLLVQYNTNNRIGPLKSKIGPYEFTISRDRVTDEKAKVNFLLPEHAALNQPNKITDADFANWIQERGIYFTQAPDERYQKIFSMADPGEGALDTSTIVAAYGKGNFVYTGLAFFRQLPAGVPGAYRIFANLISLPSHP